MGNNQIFRKRPFKTKNPRRWTKGLPGRSISVLAFDTQARSFTIHESSHEKVGISQHENRGGRFVFRQGCFSWLFVSWLIRMVSVFFVVERFQILRISGVSVLCFSPNLIQYDKYMKQYNSRTSHFSSLHQHIILHHTLMCNSLTWKLPLGPWSVSKNSSELAGVGSGVT